jgi:hypothetical protein
VSKTKILFAAYGGGHMKSLIPIIKVLSEDTRYNVITLALTTGILDCIQNKLTYITYQNFIEGNRLAIRYGKVLTNHIKNDLLPHGESIAYMGLSYLDLVTRIGKKNAKAQYIKAGRHAFLQYTVAEKILNEIQPDILVSTSSPKTERALLELASRRKIKTISLLDLFGLGCVWYNEYYCDKICVISKKSKDEFSKHHRISKDKIVVTGNTNFDQKILKTTKHHIQTILFATQPILETCAFTGKKQDVNISSKVYEYLCKTLKQLKNYKLKVRFHPNEVPFELSDDEHLDYNNNLDDTLKETNILITYHSSVTLQAWLAGIKVINLNILPSSYLTPYSKYGYSYGINNLKDLNAMIHKVGLNDKKIDIHNELKIPNNPVERIINVIKNI